MSSNWKKFAAAATGSLVATSCLLSAADDDAMRNLENRVNALESRKNCGGMVNPPARPTQKNCWGAYVTVDPLLLEAHENGLGIAVKTKNTTSFFGGHDKVKNPNFNWDWGFRVGLGLNLPHDGWDLYLNWTRFHTNAKRAVNAPQGGTLYPVAIHPGSVAGALLTADKARYHWHLRLNEIDLELGREFFVSKWLTMRPFAGMRTAWIDQRDETTLQGLHSDPNRPNKRELNRKNNYWGLGIRGGLDTQWGLGCGWSIFANYSASLLYGRFSVDVKQYSINALGVRTTNVDVGNPFRLGRAITDFILGVRYDYMFCNERYHIGIQVGWEQQMFYGQNQFTRFVDDTAMGAFVANQGDLTLQGYSARVRFDF